VQDRVIRFVRQRDYPMSVEEAWRLLADTDHLNRTVGLPSVRFSPLDGPDGGLARRAEARAFGVVPLAWTEYPFNWVRNRSYRVRREFERGPLSILEAGIELEPAGEGVRVRAFADYTPANWTGRFLWRLGNATVTDLLAFCDTYLSRKAAGRADPTPVPSRRRAVDRVQLERGLERLARSPVRPDLVGKLRERILEGSDDQLVGVRAFALADAWSADRMEVLHLLLHATRAGLFELRWEVVCPNCRVSKVESTTLAGVPQRFHCDTCGIGYDADFDERVELRFSVHPGVREASDAVYCIGGPLRVPHVASQQYLLPLEERPLEVPVDRQLRLRAVGGDGGLRLRPGAPAASSRPGPVRLSYAKGRWSTSPAGGEPDELTVPAGARVSLRNQTGSPMLAVVEEVEWGGEQTTAAQVTTLQEFRDLFGAEVLSPGRQLAVRGAAFVFSDLRGSTSLYEGVGDAPAYGRVHRHFEFVREQVRAQRGAVVKTMGDGVMAAFSRLEDAAAAALAIQREIGAWCRSQGIDPPLVLRTGLHHGPVIAVNANGQLDYFGRTVNVAARLSAAGQGGDVVLLREVLEELGGLPGEASREPFRATLRGLEGERELVRVRPSPASPGSGPG
jgi:class 3 adenylate cyclase